MIRPAPKPTKEPKSKKKKTVPRRKMLEKELEALSRELVWWRDGGMCVLRNIDGGRCGGAIQWGHFIPRQRSSYLKFALGNTFCQCSNHNGLHQWNDPIFNVWYGGTFGQGAFSAISQSQRNNKGKPMTWELEEWIDKHKELLDDRPSAYEFEQLVELGYFGYWPQQYGKEGF